MEVSRSGFYKYLQQKSIDKQKNEIRLIFEVKVLAQETRLSYGKRRMSKALKLRGFNIGVFAARTLMKKAGIYCKQRRKYKITTNSDHNLVVADNILNRNFTATAPNKTWVTDITYIKTKEGWLYVAAVLDLYSRKIIGWAMDNHMRESLVTNALKMALIKRIPQGNLLHHSDRGIQYVSKNYQSILKKSNIIVSMSRKGNCWDNAVMERFWGSLKSEQVDHQNYSTRFEAKHDIIHYIESFYNQNRLHSSLNYLTPNQFEKISLN